MNESQLENLDYLLEDSCSQTDNSLLDLDSILRPLSDSQQEKEAVLDQKDQYLRNRLEVDQGEHDQERALHVMREIPVNIKRKPPGLMIISSNPLRFCYSDLHLETDFGWSGRERVLGSGFCPKLLGRMLGTDDRMLLVRYLAPDTGQNNLISSEEEFQKLVNFFFYLATVTVDTFSVIEKCLFDLLKSYGYRWKLTTSHVFTSLDNLGVQLELIPEFCQLNNINPIPFLASFYTERVVDQTNVTEGKRLVMIHNTLHLVGEILTLSDRSDIVSDKSDLLSVIHILTTMAQDQTLVDDTGVIRQVRLILHTLLPASDLQDTAEILSTGFLPGQLFSLSCLPWNYNTLPDHMREGGINHPHNMLAVGDLLPHTQDGLQLRQILAFLNLQLILGVKEVDLPGDVTVIDMLEMIEEYKDLWDTMSLVHHYPMRCILGLMDQIFCSMSINLWGDQEQLNALKRLISLLEDYYKKIPNKDPLDLDPVTVSDVAAELITRWKLEVDLLGDISG